MNPKKLTLTLLLTTTILLCGASTTQAQTYQTATTITGSSDQTTNYFNIPSGEWKITWSYTSSTPEYALISAFVYPKGESALYTTSIMSTDSQTNGVTYVHEGNQEYYMKIGAANIDSYTFTIEYESPEPSPSVPEFSTATIFLLLAVLTGSLATVAVVKKRHVL